MGEGKFAKLKECARRAKQYIESDEFDHGESSYEEFLTEYLASADYLIKRGDYFRAFDVLGEMHLGLETPGELTDRYENAIARRLPRISHGIRSNGVIDRDDIAGSAEDLRKIILGIKDF